MPAIIPPSFRRLSAAVLAWLALWLACLLPAPAVAAALSLETAPALSLGEWTGVLVEEDAGLDIATVAGLARAGRLAPVGRPVPAFGIAAPPVWLHLALDNGSGRALPRQLLVGTTWIDRLDVWLLHEGEVVAHWRAGDGDADRQRPLPALGYVFSHDFSPGRTELFVRAQTADPLVLPLRILDPAQAAQLQLRQHYSYGLLYGFLLALVAYTLLLYSGLRERSYLDYALYLASFVFMNLAYTGHGYAWLWPDSPGLQRWIILVAMVAFAVLGLRFASRFLGLAQQAPRVARAVRRFGVIAFTLLAMAILTQQQGAAALVAFTTCLLFAVGMIALGMLAIRRRQEAGYFFLAAALCATPGVASTTLAVWGSIPFNGFSYRAVEAGVLLEAVLLALALTYQVRLHQRARQSAEQLANTDPLTGLLNRRAFRQQGEAVWAVARRNNRPLSLIVLDLDHFKAINDQHGHATGDRALEGAARLLAETCRRGDLVARWGGEEFILLLPETGLGQALLLAERLRAEIAAHRLVVGALELQMTASLGVATRTDHASLDALVGDADDWLYRAKRGGRNRVCAPDVLLQDGSD